MSDTNSQQHHSSTAHNPVQKSTTLNRRYVRRPHSYTRSRAEEADSLAESTAPVAAFQTTPTAAQTVAAPTTQLAQPTNSDFINRFLASAHAADAPAQAVSVASPANAMQPTNAFQSAVSDRIAAQNYTSTHLTQTTPADIFNASADANAGVNTDLDAGVSFDGEVDDIAAVESSLESAANAEKSSKKSAKIKAETTADANADTVKTDALTPDPPANNQSLAQAIHAIAVGEDSADKSSDKSDKKSKSPKVRRTGNTKRFVIAFSAACACVAALGVFIHLNMPDVSFRVAAMQTGIEASYPAYIPRDFQLTSVYTEEEGAVTLEFTGPKDQTYSISEEKSSWDSNALLNNFVKDQWGEDYTVIREQGITIYTLGSKATWVNGGILYYISADNDTLTKKQLKNIAVSL